MRRVVVTGGGTGMGRSIAERFASDGDEVFVIGRRKEVLERAAAELPGGRVHPLVADVTDTDDILRVAEELSHEPVDVLVNNAGGIVRGGEPGPAGAFDRYRRMLDSNLVSAMVLTDAVWANLRRPGGRVISISSIAAQRGGGGAYAAAKAGLGAWGFGLAKQGGPEGITVNTVAPGYVQDTEFFNASGRSGRHDALVAETVVGRAGVPGDVAATVRFLASDEASWITGQVISVNGGALMG